MEFLQSTLGKIVTAALALGVVAAAIAWYQMEPGDRSALIGGVGRALGWLLAVLALPWASFLVVGWAAKFDTNAAGVALVGGLTVLEFVGLGLLFGWNFGGALGWAMVVAAILLAATYNLFTCDWLAEKLA
jgi:hypothetical protein